MEKSLRKTKQKRRRSAPPALPLPSLILRIAGPRANGAATARGKRPRVRTYWAKKTLKNFNNFAVRRKSRRSETKFWLAYPVGPALPAKVRQRQSQTKCLMTRLQKLFPLRPRKLCLLNPAFSVKIRCPNVYSLMRWYHGWM